jgi:hypothetical protein
MPGAILLLDGMLPTFLVEVFAQEMAGWGIDQANVDFVPLHVDLPPDPTRRCAIEGGIDFDTAVQMYGACTELVIAKRLQGQRQQSGTFFGKHGGHLPLGGAVNAVSAQRSSQRSK